MENQETEHDKALSAIASHQDKIIQRSNLLKLRQKWVQSNKNKGVDLIDKIIQVTKDFYIKTDQPVFKSNNKQTQQYTGNELVEITVQLIENFATILMYSIELSKYIRTDEVISELEEISINQQLESLNEIDQKLTYFIKHNELNSQYVWDDYPNQLIYEGKKQLDRINNQYGKRISIKAIETKEYPTNIFNNDRVFLLFEYFSENYAIQGRPVEYSQIFHWLQEKEHIQFNKGVKFRDYVINTKRIVNSKFARISESNQREQTRLNELEKEFNNQYPI